MMPDTFGFKRIRKLRRALRELEFPRAFIGASSGRTFSSLTPDGWIELGG